jgi:uncharacterized protein (DUF2235 family)
MASIDDILAKLGQQSSQEDERDQTAWQRYERRLKKQQARKRREMRRAARSGDLSRPLVGRFVSEMMEGAEN